MAATNLSAVVSDNCRAERARRGWTQAELARRMGWQRASIGHLEQRRRYVSVDDLAALCSAFGVPASVMFTGADELALAALRLAE